MNADQILVMDDGEIIERGTHEELLQLRDGKYAALWMKQYKQQQEEHEQQENQFHQQFENGHEYEQQSLTEMELIQFSNEETKKESNKRK